MSPPLALYIHWPFCLAKCPYCDFNSHVRDVIPQARFAAALRAELAWEAARLGPRALGSIFFGGGTPSLMAPDTVAALIDDARRLFPGAGEPEITLEANPTSVELGKLEAFRAAGVNRVSLGVQALDAEALRFLGREHSAAEAVNALAQARSVFPRASFDLIYARPGQSRAAWAAELDRALSLCADHLSLYQLTVEPGTKFEALHRQGQFALPEDEDAALLYRDTVDACARHGLLPYEVSNLARPGAESRLTLDGRLIATRRHRAPEPWAALVEGRGHGSTAEEVIGAEDRAREMLLMGLRLAEGIDAAAFEARTGTPLAAALDPDTLEQAVEAGYLVEMENRLMATLEGRLRLDALLAALVL